MKTFIASLVMLAVTARAGVLHFKGWNNQHNLKACEGDCDSNKDCSKGLKCLQRSSKKTKVPGCHGESKVDRTADFCYKPHDPNQLVFKGWNPKGKLGRCEGDCDSNSHCKNGLVCKQRSSKKTKVPGCTGESKVDATADFCYKPHDPNQLVFKGWSPKGKLGRCEGDCDNNSHCKKGLKCQQRSKKSTKVLGCTGEANVDATADFCYKPAPKRRHPNALYFKGWNPKGKLGRCEGDCDNNSHCKKGLKCQQRSSKSTKVHGCTGESKVDATADFCYKPRNPNQLYFKGWKPKGTLKRCEGDCDKNSHCAKGLKCKQRSHKSTKVHGCFGNYKVPYNADFCYKPRARVYKANELRSFGWSPHRKLAKCQGDCDKNTDCKKGLKCGQRSGYSKVAGCVGNVRKFPSGMDFCVPIHVAKPKVTVHRGADFATGLSFLASPSAMQNAARIRMNYIKESMKLARNRAIKVQGFFNARDIAAKAMKFRKEWYTKAKKAGSLAKLTKSLHVKALAHEAAMDAKRRGAFTKWEVAKTDHANSVKRRKDAQADFNDATIVMARTAHELANCKKELSASWENENKRLTEKAAARENYVKWGKAHRAAMNKRKAAGLRAAVAAKASVDASLEHKQSVDRHMAAISRKAAARAAAIKAHMAVQHHAMNSYMYLAQQE